MIQKQIFFVSESLVKCGEQLFSTSHSVAWVHFEYFQYFSSFSPKKCYINRVIKQLPITVCYNIKIYELVGLTEQVIINKFTIHYFVHTIQIQNVGIGVCSKIEPENGIRSRDTSSFLFYCPVGTNRPCNSASVAYTHLTPSLSILILLLKKSY